MHRLPSDLAKTYDPVGCCIYCLERNNLSDEHIIPLGLGGRRLLPKASCQVCAAKTAAFEQTCQRKVFGPLRMYYDMPTRRKKERPKTLPLKVKFSLEDQDWSLLDVDQEIYPFLVTFPTLSLPDELSGSVTTGNRGAVAQTIWIRAASFQHGIFEHLEALCAQLGVAAVMPTADFVVPPFFRMLAKIAHAYSVAELGLASFEPFLAPMICSADVSNSAQWIGGIKEQEPAGPEIHELSFCRFASAPAGTIAVRIRLLAGLETPTYFVAVGRMFQPK